MREKLNDSLRKCFQFAFVKPFARHGLIDEISLAKYLHFAFHRGLVSILQESISTILVTREILEIVR